MSRIAELEATQSKIREELRFLRNQESQKDTQQDQCNATQAYVGGMMAAGREKTADEIISDLFTYHPPDISSAQQFETIRDAAKHLALVIWKNCPYGADRTTAIRKLREAVMTANAAIALKGVSL